MDQRFTYEPFKVAYWWIRNRNHLPWSK